MDRGAAPAQRAVRLAADALRIGERALKARLHRGRMALRPELDAFFAID